MGTRCLTVMYDVHGEEIAVLYRQFDGYPEGHGEELEEFLKDMEVVNGLPMLDNHKIANGGGCLAAQIVSHFKTDAGGFYLHPAGTRGVGSEYVYHVRPDGELGTVKVDVEEV